METVSLVIRLSRVLAPDPAGAPGRKSPLLAPARPALRPRPLALLLSPARQPEAHSSEPGRTDPGAPRSGIRGTARPPAPRFRADGPPGHAAFPSSSRRMSPSNYFVSHLVPKCISTQTPRQNAPLLAPTSRQNRAG